jgi:hypothetical protein
MKIRITNLPLTQYQTKGQVTAPGQPINYKNWVEINGTKVYEGEAGYEEARKKAENEFAPARAQIAAWRASKGKPPATVTAQSNPQPAGTSILQGNNPFQGVTDFFNKSVKPLFQRNQQPTAPAQQNVPGGFNLGNPGNQTFFNPTGNKSNPYTWMPSGQSLAAQPTPQAPQPPAPSNPLLTWNNLGLPTDPAYINNGLIDSNKGYVTKQDTEKLFNDMRSQGKNLQNTFKIGSAKDVKQAIANYNAQFGTQLKDPRLIKLGAKGRKIAGVLGQGADALQQGIAVTSALTDFIDNKNQQNRFNSYMRDQQMSDNLYPVVQGSRGDYVQTGTSYGAFRPDQMVVNKGMFAQMGGQLNLDNMKIRITSGPDKMEYGGQAKNGYGLDLGSGRIYEDMNESSFDNVSNTMSEIKNPNEPYVLETEGDEEVLRPDGTKFRLKGKSHAEGGIKNTASQIPTGSFVYSKKLKENNPEILAAFNKTYKRGGVSYSDISKQYDLNKFKAILDDPNADPLAKSTAQMMTDNYKKKLGQLALAQESKKGFKDGVPQVAMNSLAEAAYGGYIPQYQTKGEVAGYKPWKGDKYENTKNASTMTAEQIDTLSTALGYTGPKDNLSLQRWLLTQPKTRAKLDELHKLYGMPKAKKMDDGLWGYRWDILLGDTPPPKVPPKIPPPEIPEKDKPRDPLIPPIIKTGKIPPVPYDFLAPDKMSMLAAGMNPPKKYLPYYANYKANLPTPTFYSPERELAANAEQANIMTQSLANFANPQAFMSNASAVQGKAAEQAANTLGKYNNLNVGVANQFSPMIAETLNKQAMYAAERANELFKGNTIANQAYDNAKRAYVGNLAKSYANAWNNRMNLGDINDSMAYYYKDPATGKNIFKGPVGSIKDLGMYGSASNMGMNPGASVGNFGNAFKSLYKNYLAQLEDDEDIPADKKLTAEEKKKKAAKLADLDIQSRRSTRSFNSRNPFQFNQRNTQYTGLEDFSDQDFMDEEE